MARLTADRIAAVAAMRIGPPPRTLDSIGHELGITRERVRQMLVQAATGNASLAASLQAAKLNYQILRHSSFVDRDRDKTESRMSMVRVNRRLLEQGLKWCSSCKRVVPLEGFPRPSRDGGVCIARCKACAALLAHRRRAVRRTDGLCVMCGSPTLVTVAHCASCRVKSNRSAAASTQRKKSGER